MGTYKVHPNFLTDSYAILDCGKANPNPANTRMCLLRPSTSISAASTKANIIAAEVASSNGYTRQIVGKTVSSVDTSGDTLTINNHGLSDTNIVYICVSDGGSAPGGLSTATPYYVVNSATSTIQLSLTSGGSAIDITSAGSGTIIVKGLGAYDVGDKRLESISNSMQFSASGGTIQHQGYFVLRNSESVSNIAITSIDTSTDQITLASHGLSTGDEVMITTDDGGTQPSGISDTTIYYARAVSSSVFSLHPTSSDASGDTNKVNITSTGSGTIRLRYANGDIEGFNYFDATETITDGSYQTIILTSYRPSTGTGTGV